VQALFLCAWRGDCRGALYIPVLFALARSCGVGCCCDARAPATYVARCVQSVLSSSRHHQAHVFFSCIAAAAATGAARIQSSSQFCFCILGRPLTPPLDKRQY
jgi:hypothetical protein